MYKPIIAFIILILTLNTASAQFLFSSPENHIAAVSDFIEQANQTIYISVYEFTSPQIMGFLEKKENATIIVEGGPPGGLEEISKKILCKLSEKYKVYLYKGGFRFLHAKYMISGDSVLVSSENFADSKNRGWSVWVSDKNIANKLLEIFQEDLEDSVPFECNLDNYSISPTYSKSFSTTTDYVKVQIESLDLVTAPENAVEKITQLIRSANESVYIEQFYIRNWGENKNPFLGEAIEKARQGLEVKILLDSVWYNQEENGKIVDYVNSIAEKENLNLEAKLIDLKDLEKLHNKGMIIDKKIALVSSINWNENSPTNNREVGLIVEGNVDYFVDLFKRDFQGEKEYVVTSYIYLVLSIVAVSGFLYMFRNRI